MEAAAAAVQSCATCSATQPRYKCPICRAPYCSVACCQTHGESCTPPEHKEDTSRPSRDDQRVRWDENNDHMVSEEALSWLGESRRLRSLLANQHLRQLVTLADTTGQPDATMRDLMVEPLFVEFADECIRVVEGHVEPDADDSE